MASSRLIIPQAAVIPVHRGNVCLVLSSSGRRWVFPKGSLEYGEEPAQTALREAWEEAGLSGLLQRQLGDYSYEKRGLSFHVTAFLMEVAEIAEDWPERSLRSRRWLPPRIALRHFGEPERRRWLLDLSESKADFLPAASL